MGISVLLLCVFSVSPVRSIFDGTCLRKEPPPDVLVLSPGNTLVLTCSGHVKVDGVKVSLNRDNSNTNKRRSSPAVTPSAQNITSNSESTTKSTNSTKSNGSEGYDSHSTEAGVTAVPAGNRSLGFTDTGNTTFPHLVEPTNSSRRLKRESDWEHDDMDVEGDYEDEEGEEGSRVTRGIQSRPQWTWNKKTVGNGARDWGKISFGRNGAALSLASVRVADSGKYTCHHKGRERFAIKVIVADSPETPSLFCYKRSPSSKIRCESLPQKPVIRQPSCYLALNKRVTTSTFHHIPCSYSSERSRCWCALDYNDDDSRALHTVYLCLTSIGGSATSAVLQFTPLSILRPDPPSNIIVKQEEGRPTMMKVTWNLPKSWKMEDRHFELIYEITYRPSKSSFHNDQVRLIPHGRSYNITDAIPGVEYAIKIRTRDEYDGLWSEWSTPVHGRSWTVPVTMTEDMTTTAFEFPDIEDSGSGTPSYSGTEADNASEVSHNVQWVSGLFALLSVILAVYLFRHKDKFISKLPSHHVISKCGDLTRPPPSAQTPPTAQTAPEVQGLVTFAPQHYQEHSSNDEEEEEENKDEHTVNKRTESMHFNNTSYFLVQREG